MSYIIPIVCLALVVFVLMPIVGRTLKRRRKELKIMEDTYGSALREGMKKSMEEPYRSLNRRDAYSDPVFYWASWVVGTVAALLIVVVIVAQLWMKVCHVP